MLLELYNNLKYVSKKWFQHIEYKSKIENNEDITWCNDFFINPSIRYGHLEYFKSNNGKIEVLHCTFFPCYFKNLPIYGFDVIALNGIVTGIFCDFTTCIDENSHLSKNLKNIKEKYKEYERKLPEWADFFSKNFISISPKDLNKDELITDFVNLFKNYVEQVKWNNKNGLYLSRDQILDSIDIQNLYSINQRKNDKTFKALSAYIGSDNAKDFIENVLFPIYPSNAA
jgi:phycocyanobilin:ferredoxin oxidoreductase